MIYYINPSNINRRNDETWEPILQSFSANVPNWLEYGRHHDFVLILAPLMRKKYEIHVLARTTFSQESEYVEITTLTQLKAVQLKNMVLV